ncbi:MAG: hypothetical protein OXI19_03790 [Gemmatimonadota bacterium]|nr:hypothetical protein [Gemmatimonadota bacterium]
MFAKTRLQAFTYYNEFDRADRWRDDFAELKAGGFQYVVFRDGFDLRNQLASEDQTDRVKEMIGTAADAGIRSILHIGNPKALYLLPDTRAWRLDYVRRVSEVFGSCKGLYALQLEDAPTGGSEYPEDRWQQVMESVEGRLLTMEMTEDGYRHGRRIWQMEQHALFTAEVVRAVKKVKSNLKTTMAFHLDALLPAETLVHFQQTARALDFVIIDPGSPPVRSAADTGRLIRWSARAAGSLAERDVWMVVGSQMMRGRYQATLRELREWSGAAIAPGVSAVGWHNWDDTAWWEGRAIRGRSLSESNPEQWAAISTLSRSVTEMERANGPSTEYRCLLSYDSFASRVPALDVWTPHGILEESTGREVGYASDHQVSDGDKLSGCELLCCTPCPTVKEAVVERLIRYMRAGGWIVGSADDFRLDEGMRHGDARARVFGIQAESVLNDPDRILLTAGWPDLPEGAALDAHQWRVRPAEIDDDVRVIGRWGDGSPAVILKPHKDGGALYIGTDPYRSADRDRNGHWRGFLKAVLDREVLRRLSKA